MGESVRVRHEPRGSEECDKDEDKESTENPNKVRTKTPHRIQTKKDVFGLVNLRKWFSTLNWSHFNFMFLF